MTKVTISDYRKKARVSLEGQWGINAWVIFLSLFVSAIIQQFFDGAFQNNSTQTTIFNFILENFLLFAFTYALYYIALVIVRGGRAKTNLLFTIFQKEYFGPVLIIHLLNTIVNWAVNALVLLPGIMIGGINTYTQLLFNPNVIPQVMGVSSVADIGFILLTFLMMIVSMFVTTVVAGLFQFAAWTKFDYPSLTVMQSLRYAWFLLKDRIGTYIVLQLSFIGWYILGILALFFGLLWVIAYVNVTIAGFYEQARIEKGSPKEYFSLN
ncbi:hypothetical protein A5844_002395 [Enterococcus sp. 10A9_DIV0425]|uniref:Integral membrane protein n=1 Tax=Candidatus Enterococcus wittei TaxID=1987383 RepID=A0A242JWC1_9ENTE|nr:DUF975 family protein [Enterococcus sp. 10A9_DIV0425]OTP09615.1 hypothetical protein A5844_002395 [Enterococcus sp. 10A9_DIV0425]THE15247.1 DUF975 family protein [Enterococcus hirae]